MIVKNEEILKIKLNCKDLQFLLGVSEDESKNMIASLLTEEEKGELKWHSRFIPGLHINGRVNVPVERMKWVFNSPNPDIHGEEKIYTIISNVRENGIPNSMKRRLFNNEKCVLSARICGQFHTLNKILTIKQRMEYGLDLKRAKINFLAFNKPIRGTKYNLTEEEKNGIDSVGAKMFEEA